MAIAKDSVVLMHYTLKDDAGTVIDTSDNKDPLAYLHGHGNIIPGLEKELEGKAEGDKVNTVIAPADGYGDRNDKLIQTLPKDSFDAEQKIEPGMQFHAQGPEGQPHVVTVTEVKEDGITVDGNHPLAGVTLHFDVEIVSLREATSEELEHGHVHGPGGHHH